MNRSFESEKNFLKFSCNGLQQDNKAIMLGKLRDGIRSHTFMYYDIYVNPVFIQFSSICCLKKWRWKAAMRT